MERLYSILPFDWYLAEYGILGWKYFSTSIWKTLPFCHLAFSIGYSSSKLFILASLHLTYFLFFTWEVCSIFIVTTALKFHNYIPIFTYLICEELCGLFQPGLKASVLGNFPELFRWWCLPHFSLFSLTGTPGFLDFLDWFSVFKNIYSVLPCLDFAA